MIFKRRESINEIIDGVYESKEFYSITNSHFFFIYNYGDKLYLGRSLTGNLRRL